MENWQKVKKTKGFKFYGLSLVVMILAISMLVLPVLAMTTTEIVSGVQVAASSDWTVSTSAGTVSVTKSGSTSSGCSSTDSTNDSATLTITNTSSDEARLSFDYTYSAGTLYIAGTGYTAGGTYSADIAAGGTVSVYLTSPSGSSSSGTSVLSNFVLTSLNATAEVTFGEGITAKIDGETVDATDSYEVAMSSSVTATAGAAEDGMQFAWWAINGDYYSDSTSLTWSPSSDGDFEITAVYIPDGAAVFSVGTSLYYDLGDAISAAGTSGTITMSISGTLYSGEGASGYDATTGETNYTIPSGITLIVPRQEGDDGSLTWASSTITAQSVYRELIVAEDTTITVKGTMILSGKQGHSNPRSGSVIGPYGLVTLYGDIIVADGGQLDAFGYIKGDGLVTAQDGSNVREILEITDFCGGTKTSNIYSYMFPVSQYFIQNIQTDYRIETGAKLEAHYYVYMTLTTEDYITYIDDTTDAMFQLTDGYVIRHYDEDDPDNNVAYADRLTMELHGEMYSASLAITFMSKSVDSKNYELPVPENMTLNITEGSTFYMQNAYKLLPGTKIEIDEGGELEIISGGELYIYNTDDYTHHYGSNYTAYNIAKTVSSWGDAEIINNGTITINGGAFYESESDGAIINGTGVIVYENDQSSSNGAKIYEYAYSSSELTQKQFYKVTLDGINDSNIATENGTVYQGTEDGIWYNTNGVVDIIENTTTTVEDNQIAVDVVMTPDYSVTDADFVIKVGYGETDVELISGETSISLTDVTMTAGETYVLETLVFEILDTCDGTITVETGSGTWTVNGYEFLTRETNNYYYYLTYTITYSDGTASVNYTANDEDITLPVLDADTSGNEFLGWSVGDSTTVVTTLVCSEYSGDLSLTAVWDETITYTITYSESVGDDAVTSYTNKTTETITLPTLEKDYYAFAGWYVDDTLYTEIDPATAQNYDLTAKWTAITYTITFSDSVEAVTYTVEDGTVTLPTPEKDGFAGWYVEGAEDTIFTTIDATTASDMTLTAKWSLTIITYTISFGDDYEAMTYTNETTETITLPVLEDTNEYTFDGWYVTGDGTQTIITTIDPAAAQDYILTAKWTEVVDDADVGDSGSSGGGTTLPDDGDDDQTTTETSDIPSTGDTIKVIVTTDDESEETVELIVTIITNKDVVDDEKEVETTGYNALTEDTQMIVLSVMTEDAEVEPATPAETETTDEVGNTYVTGYYYNGQPMYYSPLYEAYVYIFDETEGFDPSLVTEGEAIVLEYDGDIYGDDGEVTAFDVSRIYRLAMGEWSDGYDVVDMQSRLEADVNGDGVVDINDALYVLQMLWD